MCDQQQSEEEQWRSLEALKTRYIDVAEWMRYESGLEWKVVAAFLTLQLFAVGYLIRYPVVEYRLQWAVTIGDFATTFGCLFIFLLHRSARKEMRNNIRTLSSKLDNYLNSNQSNAGSPQCECRSKVYTLVFSASIILSFVSVMLCVWSSKNFC